MSRTDAAVLPITKLSEVQAVDLISTMMVSYAGETVILDPHDPWSKFIENRERMNAMLARIDREAMKRAKVSGSRS
jgi:hypothetical protein